MRPDWASGPEWEGWRYGTRGQDRVTRRRPGAPLEFYVWGDGRLYIYRSYQNAFTLPFDSPADALEVANLIAEKLGGWGE